MTKYNVIVSIKLKYLVDAENKQEAIEKVENAELPKGYVEGSFRVQRVNEYKDKGADDDEDYAIKIR